MSTDQMLGLVGGIVGSVIGIAGGLYGTYRSIKRTNGPKERAFMIKASVVCWLAITLFLVLLAVVPNPYGFFLFPYGFLLPLGIIYGNRLQQRIRKEEVQSQTAPPPP